ncbi:MAG: hypothetical protein IJ730_03580 [Alphaproteobacteria bacterium]|nr:hypothetical protein [Alphaproteobacteria bacterium]
MSDYVSHDAPVLADSECQGPQKLLTKPLLHHKRRRKVPLTPEQKVHNTLLSFKRVFVEHVFAQLKSFRTIPSQNSLSQED